MTHTATFSSVLAQKVTPGLNLNSEQAALPDTSAGRPPAKDREAPRDQLLRGLPAAPSGCQQRPNGSGSAGRPPSGGQGRVSPKRFGSPPSPRVRVTHGLWSGSSGMAAGPCCCWKERNDSKAFISFSMVAMAAPPAPAAPTRRSDPPSHRRPAAPAFLLAGPTLARLSSSRTRSLPLARQAQASRGGAAASSRRAARHCRNE